MKLTKIERLILINQYEILMKIEPESEIVYSEKVTALLKGYSREYPSLFEGLEEELSEKECQEVVDILNMFRAIVNSLLTLGVPIEEIEYKYRFTGFDGNNETEQAFYAKYLREEKRGYMELKYGSESDSIIYDSHRPMLPKYREMFAIWKSFGSPLVMSKEQIDNVTG